MLKLKVTVPKLQEQQPAILDKSPWGTVMQYS